MKNTKRSAFTIVELVIVIAVIAILSAVLIPTFGSIIESANKAVDTQLVAQINTVLAIEDVLGGGVNDAVEIQKVVKENGLKLQTKSKGQYIWYDIENKRVVLGGLDENGIVLDSEEPTAALDANGPALISDTNVVTEIRKGQFIAATSPENFVEGYLFLSTDSADNLADAIHTLRNPKGADPVKSISDAIAKIKKENTVLGTNLESFMNTTAVMTEDGTFCINSANKSNVDRVIVSPDMTEVTTTALNQLADYPNVIVVDLHSGITSIDGQKATTDHTNVFFVYNSEGISKIDKEFGGNNNNLITLNERSDYLHAINWVDCIYDPSTGLATISETKNPVAEIKASIYKFNYEFAYELKAGTDSLSYDFIGFSLNKDGSRPFELGNHEYELTDAEKYKIDEQGYLTIYRVYYKASSDFKIGNAYYSSKTVTSMLADNDVVSLPSGTATITVVSTSATLGSATETSLTIPSGVELLLPYKSDKTKNNAFNKNLGTANGSPTSENNPIDYDTIDGQTKLTIAGGVTLNVASGATIYIDAQCNTKSTPVQGYISNNCGVLVVDGTIVSNGNITALGIIRGAGSITAESGTVTEVMTLYDWHGGTNSNGVIDKDIMPFHNWRVDNIRVPLTLKHQTTYKMTAVVDVSIVGPQLINVEMAGPSNSLFKTTEGDVIQRAMSENGNSKLTIVSGTVEDAAKSTTIYSKTVNFTKVSMPLSHFDVEIQNGAALTLSNNIYMVMPGSSVTVDEGATLNINTKVLVCNTYTPRVNVTDSSVAVPLPQYPNLSPARLVNNGTLNFNSDGNTKAAFAGEILSERSGAKIDVKTGTVGELKIKDGFYKKGSGIFGSLTGSVHYVEVAALHTKAFINDGQQTLSGSYTSTVTKIGDELYVTWN